MKRVFVTVLILSLVAVVVPSTWVGITVAQSGILIRRDGGITPKSAPISTSDNITYSLTDDLDPYDYGGIEIDRSNIILDGTWHSIRGMEDGIWVSGETNVTIENICIRDCGTGISTFMATGCRILSSNITNNSYGINLAYYSDDIIIAWNNITGNSCGIRFIYACSRNAIFENTIANNGIGMDVLGSLDNCVIGNTIANNGEGVFLSISPNTTLSGNIFSGNHFSFGVDGWDLPSFENSVDTSNLVDGKAIHYFVKQKDLVINPESYPEIGYLALVECTNMTVEKLELTNNIEGVLFAGTNNSKITANSVTNNKWGIYLVKSSENNLSENDVTTNEKGIALYPLSKNNTLVGNNITANALDGVTLDYVSDSNTIRGNYVTANNASGIKLSYSKLNSIVGNIIAANKEEGINIRERSDSTNVEENNVTANGQDGILVSSSSYNILARNIVAGNENSGIIFDNSNGNEIEGNTLAYNIEGVHFYNSSYNSLSQNDISNNIGGIDLVYSNLNILTENSITECTQIAFYISLSSNNYIYHNNFWNNMYIVVHVENSSNIWDSGYPYGGNYWSDYDGIDLYSGQYQNQMYNDGIGDTPHEIDAHNMDRYPLMNLWSLGKIFTATHNNQTYDVEVTSSETAQNFSFNDVSREMNFNLIDDQSTTGYCRVVFEKELISDPVLLVNDTLTPCATVDNMTHFFIYFTCQFDSTSIKICQRNPADVNRDEEINIKDVYAVALAYGSFPGHPRWNPTCDINNDLKIDIKDYYVVCKNYGKVYS